MARVKPLRRIQTSDKDLNQIQDSIKESFDGLIASPLANALVLPKIVLATGSNQVPHGLGRNYQFAFHGLPSAPATLSVAASPDPSKYLTVVASAPCVVDIWVT